MKSTPAICQSLHGKLIVSCQASAGDAFRDSGVMARFARASVDGGAAGIRAEGVEDVQAIRAAVSVPIIGIRKSQAADGRILITPSVEAARDLAAAGAGMIALDCTARGQRYGALDRLRQIKQELKTPVLADIIYWFHDLQESDIWFRSPARRHPSGGRGQSRLNTARTKQHPAQPSRVENV